MTEIKFNREPSTIRPSYCFISIKNFKVITKGWSFGFSRLKTLNLIKNIW